MRTDRTTVGNNEKWTVIFTGYGRNGYGLAPGSTHVVIRSRYGRYLTPKLDGRVRADTTIIGPDKKWFITFTRRGKNGWNNVIGSQYAVLKIRFGR